MKSDLVELRGRHALITGGAKRLGHAMALRLAREGCHVAIHYNGSAADARATAAEAEAAGVRAWTVQGDLSTATGASEVWEETLRQAGHIDFLVNSASIFPESRLIDLNEQELVENLRINTLAPFALLKALARQEREAAVINMLDTRYADYDRNHVAYHLSKRMLFSITRMAAEEFAPRLRVNAIAPGLVLPPEGKDAEWLDSLKHTNPLQRTGSADGIAEAAVFLLRSGFITGQVIFVDGGRHMRGAFYA